MFDDGRRTWIEFAPDVEASDLPPLFAVTGEGAELVANAGEIYVAKCEVEAQMVGVSIKFTPMSVDAARADLQKITRMVVPDIAEV